MSTNWKKQYGPIVSPDSSPHIILTVPAQLELVITKYTVSNNNAAAATLTISVTPSGGTLAQVYERVVPGFPVQGGIAEIVELEGQMLNAGDTITSTDSAGGQLVTWISGVLYTP